MSNRKTKPSDDYSKFDPETGEQTHDQAGREIPDSEPMQPPLGYTRQPTLAQQMREQIIGYNLAKAAREAGAETFEEADDFAIGDDWEAEKHSPYEANFDPMTPEERAALSTQGKDPDKILTKEEKEHFSQKPKKQASGDQPDPVIGSASDDPAKPKA